MSTDKRPEFSVIMPSYNHSRYIGDAIQSVLGQSFGDFELIIIDDHSSDDSVSIINALAAGDQRIRAYFHQRNLGISRTMNEALAKAGGKYVALFASDDLWLEEKLQVQSEILGADENLVVWSDGIIIDENSRPTGRSFLEIHDSLHKVKSGRIFNELVRGSYVFGGSLAVKRESICKLFYDENLKYLNDFRIMVDLAADHEFFFVGRPLACYRIHGENTISTVDEDDDWSRDIIRVRQYFLSSYGKKISNSERASIYTVMSSSYMKLGNICLGVIYMMLAFLFDWRNIRKFGSACKSFHISLRGHDRR
jgi:glycosyltransferase involved in cell wall biosynthesis